MFDKKANDSLLFEMLSANQVQSLHLASLDILECTGIRIENRPALLMFEQAGASVNGNLVKIPAILVKTALAAASERIVFLASDNSRKVRLEKGVINYGAGCRTPYFTDPITGEVRPTTIFDIENTGKIIQSAKNIDFVSCVDLYPEQDALSDLDCYKAISSYCQKPVVFSAGDQESMKSILEAAAGSSHIPYALAFSVKNEMPLIYSDSIVKQLFLCADAGIPVVFQPAVTAGLTGPAKLAGSLALGNAASLAALVLHQMKRKGAPFIYGIDVTIKGQKRNCTGGPEVGMLSAAVGQLGEFYGLPTYCFSGISDSFSIDAQAGRESIYSIMLAALGGANLIYGNGMLGSGMIGSPGKILFDDECISFTNFFLDGIEYNEDTLALDLIDRIGPGGNFVNEEHTFRYFKKETWYPDFLNRKPLKSWESGGSKTIEDLVAEKVSKILAAENSSQVTEQEGI